MFRVAYRRVSIISCKPAWGTSPAPTHSAWCRRRSDQLLLLTFTSPRVPSTGVLLHSAGVMPSSSQKEASERGSNGYPASRNNAKRTSIPCRNGGAWSAVCFLSQKFTLRNHCVVLSTFCGDVETFPRSSSFSHLSNPLANPIIRFGACDVFFHNSAW